MPTPESGLAAALDALPAPVVFWWRDDDAGRDDPRLGRLLSLAETRGADLALAVVPEWLEPAADDAIVACPRAVILQHGIAHADHARPGEKRIELGGSADPDGLAARLAAGRERLAARFGDRFLPVLVPPWNRISPDLAERLPALGFVGLSRFGSPGQAPAALREVDASLDLVLWREGRRPMALPEIVAALTTLLGSPPAGPVGLLSHHLAMDGEAFLALDRVLAVLHNNPKVKFANPRALFGEAG